MIVEFRTYTLNPGTTPQFEERFAEALPARAKVSPLAAFWHTEVGPLNQVIHVWPYKDANHRAETREKARKEGIWPPKGGQPGQILKQENMLVVPAAFSPMR